MKENPNVALLTSAIDDIDFILYTGDMMTCDLKINKETTVVLQNWILELEAQYELGKKLKEQNA